MAQFMLLIRGGDEAFAQFTPEQMEQTLGQYFAWSDRLRKEGRLVGADQLADGGRTVRSRDGQLVIDGPFTETKDAVGGYYQIEAADEAEAAEIAKGCPVLNHGGLVEVRGIVQH
ncbi:MAG: YciI family protein [Thermomicrobiales bacterium]